jgi:hypothetical protein
MVLLLRLLYGRNVYLASPFAKGEDEGEGLVNRFSEDELIVRINRCGSRSIAAKEGHAA